MNDQFKKLVDELVNENLRLKSELEASQRLTIEEDTFGISQRTNDEDSKPPDQMTTSHSSVDNPIYPLPKALNLEPLEEPPDFNIPEELQELVIEDDV